MGNGSQIVGVHRLRSHAQDERLLSVVVCRQARKASRWPDRVGNQRDRIDRSSANIAAKSRGSSVDGIWIPVLRGVRSGRTTPKAISLAAYCLNHPGVRAHLRAKMADMNLDGVHAAFERGVPDRGEEPNWSHDRSLPLRQVEQKRELARRAAKPPPRQRR